MNGLLKITEEGIKQRSRLCAICLLTFLTCLIKRPLVLLTKLRETYSDEKRSQSFSLNPKVKVITKSKSNIQGNKNMPPPKKLSRDFL